MFTSNPFAELSASIPSAVMQTYVVIMIVLVAAGTLFDIVHKGSARYFFDNWRKSKGKGSQQLGGGEWVSLAIRTGVADVLASGEFCNARRRVAHLLTMYGFAIYVITTAVMVFGYPTPATPTPALLPLLWWLGGLMVCLGGYWFWFFIRVDVVAEGNSPLRIMRADLFILSLLASVTLGLIWALLQATGGPAAGVVLRLVHHRHDGAVRIDTVVQVRSHVFQARGGVRKKGFLRERLQEQPARARRQTRAVRQRSRATPALLIGPPSIFISGDNGSHANIRLHDSL